MSFSGELRGISKAYGECHANRNVDLFVRAGTIHALVGENGAGKSTAMKILFGLVRPDEGLVSFDGAPVAAWSPEKAFARGVGMVHQHFMLAGPETVHDNLVLGTETHRFGWRDRKAEREALDNLMRVSGLQVPLDQTVDTLPIGLQSRCEILKVLYRKAKFLILDEPTAVLAPQEISGFMGVLRSLKARGHTILIVTHKLKEVMDVADEATILRGGRTIATRKISETSVEELSELMVGRRLQMPRAARRVDQSKTARCRIVTNSFDVELLPGEITGIAGIEGSGQDALIGALIDPSSAGADRFELFGEDARSFGAREIRQRPIAFIPADRHREGLILEFTLTENLRLGRSQIQARGWNSFGATSGAEKALLDTYDVRPRDPELAARALSGGNQQKLVVARELGSLFVSREIGRGVVLAAHPTRGVDLGAIELIHNKIIEAATAGAAVLLVSSELDELMALSHRIGVFYAGSIARWFDGPATGRCYDEKEIGMAMLTGGGPVREAHA